jgi:hypothetical protein
MKTLYESILGSTKAGAVSMIDTWWKSFKNSELYGKYSVQKIGNKFYIIIDDFSRMSHQHSISFERDDLDKMPKHLGGICWTDYISGGNKEKGSIRPCNIYISNIFNKKIDLSNWDLSHWQFPTLDVMVRMMFYAVDIAVNFSNLADCTFDKNILLYRIDLLLVLYNFL